MTLPTRRSAGICLHVTSLPGNYGIGELGNYAHRFVDFLADSDLGIWQFLPLGPTAYGDSPYQPLSINAGNTMLIDIDTLLAEDLLTDEEVEPLTSLADDFVDYSALIPLKTQVLARAADRFLSEASEERHAAFNAFCATHDNSWLHDFALFQILKTLHNERAWPEWDERFRHRDPEALAILGKTAEQQIVAIKVAQFLFDEQWQRLKRHATSRKVRLFGDLPIYIALDSVDAWVHNELLLLDEDGQPTEVAGVPPDYFSEDGQLWGNPLYDWAYHEASGFRWWIDRMRRAMTLCDMVRIDHFRGFESYWAVPADADTARGGEWRKGPADKLFDAMRKHLGDLPIVAEDLGIITDEVDALRERQQFPGMKVLQFLIGEPDFSIEDIPEDCICYTGTHDNDTTAGWFHGGSGDLRSDTEISAIRRAVLALTDGREDTVARDLVRLALASPARIAMAPMQDYLDLGSTARFNTPGTTDDNWRWRLQSGALDEDLDAIIRCWIADSGRGNDAMLQS